jgi:hypothetical protein
VKCATPILAERARAIIQLFCVGARSLFKREHGGHPGGMKNQAEAYLFRNTFAFGDRQHAVHAGHVNGFGCPVRPDYLKPVNFDCAA